MKKLIRIILISLLCVSLLAQADETNRLTLTPAEMQKLKKYFPNDSDSTAHLVWEGDPLKIELPLNQEKRVMFFSRIEPDLKGALNTSQLRLINDDKSLYFTALKPFGQTRIYVKSEEGAVILIDLVTDEHATNATQFVDNKEKKMESPTSSVVTATHQSAADEMIASSDTVSYVELIRFAWMSLFAPDRLIKNANSFARAPMHTTQQVSDLFYGDKVTAFPQASWAAQGHFVTAILLRNKYSTVTHINLKNDICGDWQAAVLYPRTTLKDFDDKASDSTFLFLISNKPFGDVLGVCHGAA